MVNKIYEDIYKKTNNRTEYLEECNKQKLKYSSSLRRYYDLVEMDTGSSIKSFKQQSNSTDNKSVETGFLKSLGVKKKELLQFHNGLRTSINEMKIQKVKDMKRLGFETTRIYLKQHGYTDSEINWLDDMGFVDD